MSNFHLSWLANRPANDTVQDVAGLHPDIAVQKQAIGMLRWQLRQIEALGERQIHHSWKSLHRSRNDLVAAVAAHAPIILTFVGLHISVTELEVFDDAHVGYTELNHVHSLAKYLFR